MELPDFMSYAGKFSAGDFTEKISRIAKRAGAKLVYAALILFYTLQSDKVWVDVEPEIKEKAKEKLAKWFDEDEIKEIDDLF